MRFTIKKPAASDSNALISLASGTGIFKPQEAEGLLGGVLSEFHRHELPEGHDIQAAYRENTGLPCGWVYFAPSFKAKDVWDLWWIGVAPDEQKSGVGSRLLNFVEKNVARHGGRILIIETSSSEKLSAARDFYLRRGYRNCGQIPDFYEEGEDKITFAKKLHFSSKEVE